MPDWQSLDEIPEMLAFLNAPDAAAAPATVAPATVVAPAVLLREQRAVETKVVLGALLDSVYASDVAALRQSVTSFVANQRAQSV
jgi:hypothetical protein